MLLKAHKVLLGTAVLAALLMQRKQISFSREFHPSGQPFARALAQPNDLPRRGPEQFGNGCVIQRKFLPNDRQRGWLTFPQLLTRSLHYDVDRCASHPACRVTAGEGQQVSAGIRTSSNLQLEYRR